MLFTLVIAAIILGTGWYLSTDPRSVTATPREMLGLGLIIVGAVILWIGGMVYGISG